MTQATATTASRAGRQHGGGLVQANPPRATLRRRNHCPSGGAINRRCEAASIVAFAFSAPATLAYPMTGVRQAQKLSTSLRSLTRPHAQLVMGYKHHSFLGVGVNTVLCVRCQDVEQRFIHDAGLSSVVDKPPLKAVDERRDRLNQPVIRQAHQINPFEGHERAKSYLFKSLVSVGGTNFRPQLFINRHEALKCLAGHNRDGFFCRHTTRTSFRSRYPILVTRKPDCREDCTYSPERGYNRGISVDLLRTGNSSNHNERQAQHQQNRKAGDAYLQCSAHRSDFSPHAPTSSSLVNKGSLPIFRSNVHGGAA